MAHRQAPHTKITQPELDKINRLADEIQQQLRTMENVTLQECCSLVQPLLVAIRQCLHRHPELGFQEFVTSEFIYNFLRRLGYQPRMVAGTGVIADLGEGPFIGLRADIDSLALLEMTKVSYCSRNKGVMAACGHDGHVAMLLGVALLLWWMHERGRLPQGIGYRLIFQPAEEVGDADGVSGAGRMIEAECLENVLYIVGLHVLADGSVPTGHLAIQEGPVMATLDAFEFTITGRGGHGAYPEKALSPLEALSLVQQWIKKIQLACPANDGTISVGRVWSSSDANNVIPAEAGLGGTMRTYDDATRKKMKSKLEDLKSRLIRMGYECKLDWVDTAPAVVNDPWTTKLVREAVSKVADVTTIERRRLSEDFAYYGEIIRAVFIFLGAALAGSPRDHHSPNFDFDEGVLWKGTIALLAAAIRLAEENTPPPAQAHLPSRVSPAIFAHGNL